MSTDLEEAWDRLVKDVAYIKTLLNNLEPKSDEARLVVISAQVKMRELEVNLNSLEYDIDTIVGGI